VDLRNAPVDLQALLLQLGGRIQPIATSAGVKLDIGLPTGLSAVPGDEDRLLQIFTNLIDNAIKFTPPGGSVYVLAEQDRGEVRVIVRDTGPGMSAEELTHIFDRFYQADAARGGGEKHGTGLGLAIARELTEAHGGRISVRSTLGHGAEFVVHLPPALGGREDRRAA
jgi:signal transduction histidine kinase